MRELSIYLHIPFCARKCRYCDFLSYPATVQEQEDYLTLLLKEIEKQSFFYEGYRVISVFVGGGTPSLLEADAIKKIFGKLNHDFIIEKDCEITLEANPDSLTLAKLEACLWAGVNRLSIGLQSADDEELRQLGRIHDYRTFCRAYQMARQAGFQNINIDLMSAVPGQTPVSYRQTLERVLALEPEHISAYSLILEEGTWFYEHQKELSFPTEDEDRELYELTGEMLASFNYNRYEISNYAKTGYECRHNKVYWKRGDYVGFGLGAASMVSDVRWSNKSSMREYREAVLSSPGFVRKTEVEPDMLKAAASASAEAPKTLSAHRARLAENVQYLSRQEQMEEFMFLGLRLTEGIRKQAFLDKFGIPIETVYGEILGRLQQDELLLIDDSVRLTPYGFDISNYVMSKFLF
ncbi:MAG: radical SAM family heme chaperone HemW [Lachnospiraceae bacterium]|nr:radical SAM family heme chaperone HemW [Lachnospiraceae bacterium]